MTARRQATREAIAPSSRSKTGAGVGSARRARGATRASGPHPLVLVSVADARDVQQLDVKDDGAGGHHARPARGCGRAQEGRTWAT